MLLVCMSAAACGGGAGQTTLADTSSTDGVIAAPDGGPNADASPSSDDASPATAPAACPLPAQGCPCDVAGEIALCRGAAVHNGSYVYCPQGYRVCTGGAWGSCILQTVL